MEHMVYARKYRPADFDEIIDQGHIAVTLKNAIEQNKLAHAYLFSGPRGIGKTSTARILAKALNCETGPTIKPCNKCPACLEINEGRSMDVLEIDGASNRGIDEIRSLRENVKFAPSSSRFKVYIIDEVHMLTTEAFNALLKTLEEPPAHVKFIFATTESHKVLPTILSRCQRFDFRKISSSGIVAKLKKLVSREKIDTQDDVLFALARSADGSLRDAEVILDQLNSFGRGRITLEDVNAVLGLVSRQAVVELAEYMIEGKVPDSLEYLDKLLAGGKDPGQLAGALIEHFRDIMLIKSGAEKLVDLSEEDKKQTAGQSEKLDLSRVLYCLAILSQSEERIKRQGMGRLFLELALIKVAGRDKFLSPERLVDAVGRMEQLLGKLKAGAAALPQAPAPTPTPTPSPDSKPRASVPKSSLEIKPQSPTPGEDSGAERSYQPQPKEPAPEAREEPEAFEKNTVTATAGQEGNEVEAVRQRWAEVITAVKQINMPVGFYVSHGVPLKARNGVLEVGFSKEAEFYRENLAQEENLRILAKALNEVMGLNFKISPVRSEKPLETGAASPPIKATDKESAAEMNDFISHAVDEFNGFIVQDD